MSIIYDLGLGLLTIAANLAMLYGGFLLMTWLIGKDF